jgi:SAM-dependent methyltransferase
MSNLDLPFWQGFYEPGSRPGWDLDGATPLLGELLAVTEALGLDPGPAVAVPGCGFGHDAAELARRGYQATGLDFAPGALEGARARYGALAQWRQEDWFGPAQAEFDGVFDYTCFVAMAPERRADYVAACARRLRPGGLWLGAYFHTVVNPGPPFAIPMAELRALVEPRFEVLYLRAAAHSHPRRAGREFLLVARLT